MRRPLLLPFAALSIAAACVDAPSSPVPAHRTSLAVGTPPPPRLGGSATGTFSVGGSPGVEGGFSSDANAGFRAGADLAGTAVARPPFIHQFTITQVEYNANASQTVYWMSFPKQTLPPNADPSRAQKGYIRWNGSESYARGRIFSYDPVNNGYWFINLKQYSGRTTNPFQSCASTFLCTQLVPPVVAQFYQIAVVRPDGSIEFKVHTSSPANLTFVADAII